MGKNGDPCLDWTASLVWGDGSSVATLQHLMRESRWKSSWYGVSLWLNLRDSTHPQHRLWEQVLMGMFSIYRATSPIYIPGLKAFSPRKRFSTYIFAVLIYIIIIISAESRPLLNMGFPRRFSSQLVGRDLRPSVIRRPYLVVHLSSRGSPFENLNLYKN